MWKLSGRPAKVINGHCCARFADEARDIGRTVRGLLFVSIDGDRVTGVQRIRLRSDSDATDLDALYPWARELLAHPMGDLPTIEAG